MAVKPRELHPVDNRSGIENFWKDLWYGEPPILKRPAALSGRLTPFRKGQIAKRIKDIASQASELKIGAMGDTTVRMDDKKYRSQFEYVQRIYKSRSMQTVIDLEVYLIKRFKKEQPNKVLNVSETPAWRLTSYNGYYYVYVVYNPS